MALGFDLAKLPYEFLIFVNNEGAAFDAQNFFAVHVLFFNHIKQLAKLFTFIGEQFELKVILADKLFVGF